MVSVIIPVYNGERYIEKSIKSVLDQSFRDIEIIIVDDGSTDGTANIIKKYNVRYIYQNNKGPSAARNRGIKEAKGEYISFLDADDIYYPLKIEEQVQILEKFKDVDLVYNAVNVIDGDDEVLLTLSAEVELDSKEDFYAYCLFRQPIPCPPSIMVRRKCFDKVIYPENLVNAEDYFFILEMAKYFKFKYIDKILYLYRRHQGNLTNNHVLQVKNEVNIVKDIGLKNIERAIDNSRFSKNDKNLLMAKILIKIEEYDKAKHILNTYIENNEASYLHWFYFGNINYKIKEFNKAIECYKNAINKNDNMAEAYNNLACCYGMLKKNNLAYGCFKKAIEMRKNYIDPVYNLENTNNKELKITERELRKVLTNYTF